MGKKEDNRKFIARCKAAATLLSEKKQKQYLKAIAAGGNPDDVAIRLCISGEAAFGLELKRRVPYTTRCRRLAQALPREKRVKFMQLLHDGETCGSATMATGISHDEATGIILLNTKKTTITYLVRPEDVK